MCTDAEVLLYGSGEIRCVIPQETAADAHSRRYKVPQIPLSEDDGVAVELCQRSRRPCTRWTSRNGARDVGALKVRTHQDRGRGIRCAGQETLGTPQKQIVTDQPIMGPLLTCYGRRPWGGRRFKTAICSLHEGTHGPEP